MNSDVDYFTCPSSIKIRPIATPGQLSLNQQYMYEITFTNPCVDSGFVLSQIPVEVDLDLYVICRRLIYSSSMERAFIKIL